MNVRQDGLMIVRGECAVPAHLLVLEQPEMQLAFLVHIQHTRTLLAADPDWFGVTSRQMNQH